MDQGPRNRNQGRTVKKERVALLAAILMIGVVFIAVASSKPRVAQRLEPESGPLVFKTSDSQFDVGANNQGWWSPVAPNFDFNDNFVTGTATSSGGVETRDFFTFDLRFLDLSGRTIVSALLQVNRGTRGDDRTETLALFDVSTDPATLNNNTGTSAAIFDDLGTGTVYGTYIVRFDGPQFGRAAFRLNQAAIAAISGAAGDFFSIGGTLQSLPGYLFGSTGGGDQRLVLCLDTDPDADGDGVCDAADNCPATANPEQGDIDGDQIGDLCDDGDGDGILDDVDNCPFAFNPGQEDADADGSGDSCDFCNGPGVLDSDGDGVCNDVDNCRFTLNPFQSDADGDGSGDECDNCPGVPNPDQTDTDNNGIGDACALCAPFDDFDADNVCHAADNCPFERNPDQTDTDGDGFGDVCDGCTGSGQYDCEGDGACDQADNCFCVPNPDQADGDGEGVGDACDNCSATPNFDQANMDGDSLGDACDSCPADPGNDLDGDSVCGNVDNCPSAFNPGQEDSDGNGVGDACTGGRSLIVNSFADAADDSPGDGLCASAQNECTLRAAVQETNSLFGADVITLPAGVYLLSIAGAGEDAAVSGDLDITDDLAVVGAGPETTIIDATFSGASPPDRAIEIIGSARAEISGVAIRNGSAVVGGGIRNGDQFTHASSLVLRDCIIANNATGSAGGGIQNYAMLDIFNCRVEDNEGQDAGSGIQNWIGATLTLTDSTVVGNGGPGALTGLQGGGINNRGMMTVVRSTIARNVSGSEGGAGIWNAGEVVILNSTISGNSADHGGAGGGIKSILGSVRINSSTITDNLPNGILRQGGTVNMANTMLAANGGPFSFVGPDCGGMVGSGGHNLIGNSADCIFSAAIGDLMGTAANPIDPHLSPLQDNGGPTITHGLLSGSPAMDAGDPAPPGSGSGACEETDQRGVARPVGPACDIGAFERIGPDTDGDGVNDDYDNCRTVSNPLQEDVDVDDVGDVCDNCVNRFNTDQADVVHPNGVGDACDDPEGDGVFDATDVCPDAPDAGQEDADGNGVGDACNDAQDADDDEYADVQDNCPAGPNPGQDDTDRTLVVAPSRSSYAVEPGVGISVDGFLYGVNLEFSCRPCSTATFADAVTQIGLGGRFCEYSSEVPRQIVLNDDQICVRSRLTGKRFDLDLISFSAGPGDCVDADGGAGCAAAGGETSYLLADGLGDECDNCPSVFNPLQTDQVHPNGVGDACDDPDHDGVFDFGDACPDVPNSDQQDTPMLVVVPEGEAIEIEPEASISVNGALFGGNVEFSCGACAVATFADAVTRIGGGLEFCGYGSQIPRQIVANDDRVCIRSQLSGRRFDLDLVSFYSSSHGCVDADGGAGCTAADGKTSFLLGDGVGDACDNCPLEFNPLQSDQVHPNGAGDACDDPDHDGVFDAADVCPDASDPGQQDTDHDGVGDICNDAVDPDGDELAGSRDNCPVAPNPGQEDTDGPPIVAPAGSFHQVEPGVGIMVGGSLHGENVLFSCGPCRTATFEDAVTQIGGDMGFCGYSSQVPRQIVLNDDRICMRSLLSGNPYDLDLLSFLSGSGLCYDADGGAACAAAGDLTSFQISDGVGDLCDNCPGIRNRDQRDAVHPGGGGDVCDDPDADGVFDAADICVDIFNPSQSESVACVSITEGGGQCLETLISLVRGVPQGAITISGSMPVAPESMTFELNVDSCEVVYPIEFVLNGTSLGTFHDSVACVCDPPLKSLAITDASLLQSLWKIGGDNTFLIRKAGAPSPPFTFLGTYLAWVRVRLDAAGTSDTVCLFDFGGGTCSEPDQCLAGITEDALTVERSIPEPLLSGISLSIPFTDSLLPESIDIESIPDGQATICAVADDTPAGGVSSDCVDFMKHGEGVMTINRPCNSPPAARAGLDFSAECSSSLGATVMLDGSESTDIDSQSGANDDIVLFEWFEDFGTPLQQALGTSDVLVVNLPLGIHRITLRVSDRAGAAGTDEVLVTVVDTVAPVVTVVTDLEVLWPPNHRMVPVALIPTVHDVCDQAAAALLASVTNSEPDDAPGEGDGHTEDDIQGITPGAQTSEVLLRAERSSLGAGRLYTVAFTAMDRSGNAGMGRAAVLVPHDQGGVVEPVVLDLRGPIGASPSQVTLEWTAARDAVSYNILRGSHSQVTSAGSFTVVQGASCVARGLPGTSFSGGLAQEDPPAGEAFFYFIEYFDGSYSGYGTATGRGEVVIASGDACH